MAPVAGQFKCKYPLALADCWVLATGKIYRTPAFFAIREKTVETPLESIEKEVQVRSLDELIRKP
ncbi:MAG: hypothetical protein QXL25_05615 [Candidatus Bathyarchaeia archaeon]